MLTYPLRNNCMTINNVEFGERSDFFFLDKQNEGHALKNVDKSSRWIINQSISHWGTILRGLEWNLQGENDPKQVNSHLKIHMLMIIFPMMMRNAKIKRFQEQNTAMKKRIFGQLERHCQILVIQAPKRKPKFLLLDRWYVEGEERILTYKTLITASTIQAHPRWHWQQAVEKWLKWNSHRASKSEFKLVASLEQWIRVMMCLLSC